MGHKQKCASEEGNIQEGFLEGTFRRYVSLFFSLSSFLSIVV